MTKRQIESLERRRLLAVVSWDGGGDGTNWTDPLNWSNDALPTSVDDVTISSDPPDIDVILNGDAIVKSLSVVGTNVDRFEMRAGKLEVLEDLFLACSTRVLQGGTLRVHGDVETDFGNAIAFGEAGDSTVERFEIVGANNVIIGAFADYFSFDSDAILDLSEAGTLTLASAMLRNPIIEAPSLRTITGSGAVLGATFNGPIQLVSPNYFAVGGDYVINAPVTISGRFEVGMLGGFGDPWTLTGNQTVTFADNIRFFTWSQADITFDTGITANFLGRGTVNHDNSAKVINKGTINVDGSGLTSPDQFLRLNALDNGFRNEGTINVFNNARLLLPELLNTATGVINVDQSRLEIYDGFPFEGFHYYSWSNAGKINANDSHVTFGGEFTIDDFGSVAVNGGSVLYSGIIENNGRVFEALAGADHIYFGSWIYGGTLTTQTSGEVLEVPAGNAASFSDEVLLDASIKADNDSEVRIYGTLSLQDNAEITFSSTADQASAVLNMFPNSMITGWGTVEAAGDLALSVFADNGGTIGIGTFVDLLLNDKCDIYGDEPTTFINDGTLVIRGASDADSLMSVDVDFINNHALLLQPGANVQFDHFLGDVNILEMHGDNTRLRLNGSYNFNQLTKIGEGSVVFLADESWTRSASMEIEGTVIFDHADDADATFNAIKSAVISGYANNTWTGEGLRDPLAAADAKLTLGYAKSSAILGPTGGTFRGFEVDGSATFVHHTLDADFNLDNTVNFNDVLKIAQNYNSSNKNFTDGDADFDSTVNFADLLRTSQLYGQSAINDSKERGQSSVTRSVLN